MAAILAKPTVELHVTLQITESEARALEAMAGYGDDAFVKAFYENLGKAYMKNHEQGLRTFLKSIRQIMPFLLRKADKAREAFEDI